MIENNNNMSSLIDELKEIRDKQKELKTREDLIKKLILADGRQEIKSDKHTLRIQTRTKETFNDEAFINEFYKTGKLNTNTENLIFDNKVVVNEMELVDLIKNEQFDINLLEPFNTITETKVITVK